MRRRVERRQPVTVGRTGDVEPVPVQPRTGGVHAVRLVPGALQHQVFKRGQPQAPMLGCIDQRLGMPEQHCRGAHEIPVDIVDTHGAHGRHRDTGDPVLVLEPGVASFLGRGQ